MRLRSEADATSGSSRARRFSFVALTIGTRVSELALGARDRFVVEERHDRLAERHALDREEPVPAGVQLVDDDVGLAVALECLVVVEPLDEDEVGVETLARRDDLLRSLASARRRRVEDDRACAVVGGDGSIALTSIPGGIISASGTQRIASYEPTTSAPAFFPKASSVARLPADVRAEVVHHRLLAERARGSGTAPTAARA